MGWVDPDSGAMVAQEKVLGWTPSKQAHGHSASQVKLVGVQTATGVYVGLQLFQALLALRPHRNTQAIVNQGMLSKAVNDARWSDCPLHSPSRKSTSWRLSTAPCLPCCTCLPARIGTPSLVSRRRDACTQARTLSSIKIPHRHMRDDTGWCRRGAVQCSRKGVGSLRGRTSLHGANNPFPDSVLECCGLPCGRHYGVDGPETAQKAAAQDNSCHEH